MLRTTLALALVAAPLAAQSFEGAISMTMTDNSGRAMPLTYQVKGGKIRYDMEGRGGSVGVVIDPVGQKMLMIMAAQRMVMETAIPTVNAPGGRAGGGPASVSRTGRTEMIAGYKCEHIIITDADGSSTDACITNEIGGGFQMPGAGNPMARSQAPAWAGQLGRDAFPLKVQRGDKTVLEVTKVEKKSLDASLFEAPADYQKMDMGGMMKRP